jgi:hypothetical protein
MQSQKEAQKRRLARAVGPEQTEDAARLDFQRDIVQGNLAVLVNLGELERFNHQIAGAVPSHEVPSTSPAAAGFAFSDKRRRLYCKGRWLPRPSGEGYKDDSEAGKIPIGLF